MNNSAEKDDGDTRTPCRYGSECYQRNKHHLEKYKHPSSSTKVRSRRIYNCCIMIREAYFNVSCITFRIKKHPNLRNLARPLAPSNNKNCIRFFRKLTLKIRKLKVIMFKYGFKFPVNIYELQFHGQMM